MNTDGFLTKSKIDSTQINIGVDIGEFKVKSGKATVEGKRLIWS